MLGDLFEDENGRVADTPFDPTDVGAMQAALKGKVLLGPAFVVPDARNVAPQSPPDVHPGSKPG